VNSKELTIRAIEFKKPERIPLYLSTAPWNSDVVAALFFPPRGWRPYNRKFISRTPISYITTPLRKGKKHLMDEFGSIWYVPGNETLGQVVDPRVIATWEDLKNFKLPQKTNKGRWWFAKFLFRLFGRGKYLLGSIDNFFFERMHFLRGFGNLLRDVKRSIEKLKILGEKLADWYCWLVDQWARLGANGIIATDDWGSNQSTFISPRDFDEIFKPLYQTVIEQIHDYGMHFMLHSCGNIYYLIPNLIETGVDCLQLDSPRQTGLRKLREFSGKICYCTVADISQVIPFKTPKEVEAEVLQMIKMLGPFNGGLIGTIYADLRAVNFPKDNMDANTRAYRRFGKYGEYPLQ